MDVRLLRAFIAVTEHGHFGAAADSLSFSQSGLSKQIQLLEAQLGGAVFHRGRHGAALTDLGRTLLPDAVDVVRRADVLMRRAGQAARGESGQLAVGFGLSSIELAPQAVAAFRHRYPEADVSLDDMSSDTQVERLVTGELQVGFARLPVPKSLGRYVLQTDRLALAASRDFGPLPRDPMDIAGWLASHRFIQLAPARGRGHAGQVDRFLAVCGVRPSRLQEAQDQVTILALVAAGVGVSLVPASAAVIAPAAVEIVPVEHEVASWQLGVIWNRDHRTPLVSNFLDVVKELFHLRGAVPAPAG